eukprot:8620701-Karenia_brevis.AAC.1
MLNGCLSFNVISVSAATSACEKGVQWQCLAPFLDEILKGCLTLNVISFNAAKSAFETGWQLQRVALLFDEMRM